MPTTTPSRGTAPPASPRVGSGPGRRPNRWSAAWPAVPLPRRASTACATAQRVRNALWFDHGIEVAVLARDATLSVRVSAQVYNDDDDLERLAAAVDELARR